MPTLNTFQMVLWGSTLHVIAYYYAVYLLCSEVVLYLL